MEKFFELYTDGTDSLRQRFYRKKIEIFFFSSEDARLMDVFLPVDEGERR